MHYKLMPILAAHLGPVMLNIPNRIKMKIYSLLACLLCILPTTLLADSKTDSASELYSIMLEQKLIDENFDQYWSYIEAPIIDNSEITEEIRLKLDELKEKIWLKIKSEIRSDHSRDEFIRCFIEVFNEEELRALVEFYHTPVGRSILRKSSFIHDNITSAIDYNLRMEIENFSDEIADIILLKFEEKNIKATEEYKAGCKEDENNPDLLKGYAKNYSGCSDSKYISYVERRLSFYEKLDREEYQKANIENTVPFDELKPFDKITYLSRFTILSARFDTIEIATRNIIAYEELSAVLNLKGDAEHEVNIARGWLELRRNNEERAIHYLMESTKTEGSPVLGSFGPDMTLIRELYKRGRKDAVLEYLEKIKSFWNTNDSLEYINIWKIMIKNNCPIQFQFYDTTSFPELNIK